MSGPCLPPCAVRGFPHTWTAEKAQKRHDWTIKGVVAIVSPFPEERGTFTIQAISGDWRYTNTVDVD